MDFLSVRRLRLQAKVDCYRRNDLDGFSIQKGWLVDPLPHGIHDSRKQPRVTRRDNSNFRYGSIFRDLNVQQHNAFNACLPSQGWVLRIYLVDDI